MSFLTRWFRKTEPEDYEQILASLAIDIQKRQTLLSEIRLRERRATLLVTLYAFAAWGAYVSAWYMGLLPNLGLLELVGLRRGQGQGQERVEKLLKGVPVFVGPVLILFTRRIIQMYFARKGDAEEKTLKVLYKEQRTKIEDIKKKTNYYNTRSLIERYDEGPGAPGAGPPLRQRNVSGAPGGPGGIGGGPVGSPQRGGQGLQLPSTPPRPGQGQGQNDMLRTPMPLSPGLQTHLSPQPQQPIPIPRKQWYDKVADALLGDDESTPGPAASRYALICQKCFAHNGLVKESMWEDAREFHLICSVFPFFAFGFMRADGVGCWGEVHVPAVDATTATMQLATDYCGLHSWMRALYRIERQQ